MPRSIRRRVRRRRSGRFEAEVEWHDSYEAEQHVHHYGTSSRAGVLVAGRLRQRLRQRLPRAGDLLPRAVVCRRRGDSTASVDRQGCRQLGRRARGVAPRLSGRRLSDARSSACAAPCISELQELARRERHAREARARARTCCASASLATPASKHFVAAQRGDAGGARARRAGRAARHHGARLRRERHRQGVRRPHDPRAERARERRRSSRSTARR